MSPTWDVGNTPRKRKNSAKSWSVGMSAVGFNAVDQQLYSTCLLTRHYYHQFLLVEAL